MSRILGIDLGTSTSEIAIYHEGKIRLIPNDLGEIITPSVVGLSPEGKIIVGNQARDQLLLRPNETVMEVKRLMGKTQAVSLGDRQYTPQAISAEILKYLRHRAEEFLAEKVNRAVITVPAYFTDEQRRATIEAGELAGLKVERLINEPTAAALAYGINHMKDESYLLVYDLGGGTLDVTVLELFNGVLDVRASSGNTALGGKDFDQRLMVLLQERFRKKHGLSFKSDPHAMARLKAAAESCKIALSDQTEYTVQLPFMAMKNGEPIALEETVTLDDFEAAILDLVSGSKEPLELALADAKLDKREIALVLPVGGASRTPLVRRFLETMEQEPQCLVDPDLAVVTGAAIQAAILNKDLRPTEDILITDVCPYTLGVSTVTRIGETEYPDFLNVLIPRNTTIPVSKEREFYTCVDDQEEVVITVYQGDRQPASRNNLLGSFSLSGIPPAPAEKQAIRVRFTYDANGILQVKGTIASTGKKAGITIDANAAQQDPDAWANAPLASKYRALIRRAERKLKRLPPGAESQEELTVILETLKRVLPAGGVSEEEIAALAEALTSLLYEIEDV